MESCPSLRIIGADTINACDIGEKTIAIGMRSRLNYVIRIRTNISVQMMLFIHRHIIETYEIGGLRNPLKDRLS